jgi:calcineurin-like phosphoesterase family protein
MDYLISDFHLGHSNIIEYCDRPFDSVEEMDETLIENWNSVIDAEDEVLYGGDLSVPWAETHPLDYLAELNGEMVFLIGNHDETIFPELESVEFCEQFQFKHREVPFHAVHDPADAPSSPTGWVLHGHHHNNWPDEYPFVDHDACRVNFSVELLDYRLLSVDRLVDYLTCGERFADRSAAEEAIEDDG